ncbi:MAG: pentapeptide repeat-containing protein [Anaerolineae bacterium]
MDNKLELITALLERIRSSDEHISSRAFYELDKTGLLQDGSLRGSSFKGAILSLQSFHRVNLREIDFSESELWEADFRFSNLMGCLFCKAQMRAVVFEESILEYAMFDDSDLRYARIGNDLRFTSFARANLEHALIDGDLRNSSMRYANLQNASIDDCNLCGANFHNANLRDATLSGSAFDRTTILPDGTAWSFETDLMRFTDATDIQFWRSHDPLSPAFISE